MMCNVWGLDTDSRQGGPHLRSGASGLGVLFGDIGQLCCVNTTLSFAIRLSIFINGCVVREHCSPFITCNTLCLSSINVILFINTTVRWILEISNQHTLCLGNHEFALWSSQSLPCWSTAQHLARQSHTFSPYSSSRKDFSIADRSTRVLGHVQWHTSSDIAGSGFNAWPPPPPPPPSPSESW